MERLTPVRELLGGRAEQMGEAKRGLDAVVERLDREWLEDGFLYKLRDGEFDMAGYVRFENVLNTARQLDDKSSKTIHREFVRLLWFVPQFVEWQTQRLIDRGADREIVYGASSNIRELVGSVLGEP